MGKHVGGASINILYMNKNNKSILGSLLIIGFILLSACKKEGCTDSEANNYQIFAKKDNGSCTYSGSVVLWYKVGVFTGLASYGVTNLSLYINGEFKNEYAVGFYSTSEPECGKEYTMSIELDLGSQKSKEFNYEIFDQNGIVRFTGVINVSANQCSKYELTL